MQTNSGSEHHGVAAPARVLQQTKQHHGPYFAGEHVYVRQYGGATVVPCTHQYKYGERVEVRYDDDGTTYHCYTSKLVPWPQYAKVSHAGSVGQLSVRKKHHGPFYEGEHVVVKGYGTGEVVHCSHTGQYPGRVEVRYDDDGSTYHCYPSEMFAISRTPERYRKWQVDASAFVLQPTVTQKLPFTLGERIFVKGYGFASVVDLPHRGKNRGTVKVRYNDRSTYHCEKEDLLHLQTHVPEHESEKCSDPSFGKIALEQDSFPIGQRVMVRRHGVAVVDALPTSGRHTGRVKVRYLDGSMQHCSPADLMPFELRDKAASEEPGNATQCAQH